MNTTRADAACVAAMKTFILCLVAAEFKFLGVKSIYAAFSKSRGRSATLTYEPLRNDKFENLMAHFVRQYTSIKRHLLP